MSEQTVETSNPARPAFVAAVGVLGFLLGSSLVRAFISTTWMATGVSGPVIEAIGFAWLEVVTSLVSRMLPCALLVFLTFWRIAPIRAGLSLAAVLRRSTVAALLGTAAMLLIELVTPLILSPSPRSAISGLYDLQALSPLPYVLLSNVSAFVAVLPLVALAAVLLWLWLRRTPLEAPVDAD